MTLFAPDLYRSFAIGFLAGGLILGAATFDEWAGALESPAQAAAPLSAPEPTSEFLIEPIELESAA